MNILTYSEYILKLWVEMGIESVTQISEKKVLCIPNFSKFLTVLKYFSEKQTIYEDAYDFCTLI